MNKEINILPIVETKNTFTLMLAPPGWGKTTLVLDLYEKYDGRVVFISPLRALAEEFYKRAVGLKNILSLSHVDASSDEFKSFSSKKKGLLICTAEKLSSEMIEKYSLENTLYIFDEFHLFYYWGQSFRPLLWERVMEVSNNQGQILGLTATMDKDLLELWQRDFSLGLESLFLINLGNQRLLNSPAKINNYSLLGEKVFNRSFLRSLEMNREGGTILYFCRMRRDVDRWIDFCRRRKIVAIGCIGGEVDQFLKDLEENPSPRCIFSTSALSHGVNLPIIKGVFLSYPIENNDFWIQMVGRGGRDGSVYEVHEMEKKEWRSIRNSFHSLVLLLRDFLNIRMNI
ncbi:DEAD/DEAH box helicase [Halobacteriovorax sp.]|uniref:DEAD/DEAH box helicase n=1 Tax=Halobacteriovorax sp. TaxID=2020862 RepID=UPI003565C173